MSAALDGASEFANARSGRQGRHLHVRGGRHDEGVGELPAGKGVALAAGVLQVSLAGWARARGGGGGRGKYVWRGGTRRGRVC
eukprot:366052-Chlamydomonas_euryale.AAC.41